MLSKLIKIRLLGLFSSMFRRMSGKNKVGGGKLLLFVLLAVFVVAMLLFSVGSIFLMMVDAMHEMHLDWLYFAMTGLMAVVLCFIGSIFATQNTLFNARDNELLLSMPIRPSHILASRMITLLLLNYMYSLLILVPASAVYIGRVGIGSANLAILVIGILVLPLISLSLSCVCGWLIGLITSKMRRKNLFSTILIVGFFVVYFMFFMNLNQYLTRLLMNGEAISAALRRTLPPAYFFGSAIANANWLHLLYTALICIVPITLIYWLLSRSFIRIVTTQRGTVRVEYKERAMKAGTPGKALLKKELDRFFRTPMYIFNCGIGAVMELLLAGVLIVKGPGFISILVEIPAIAGAIPAVLAAILALCSAMICTTSPSISLEGHHLWILKSSPILPRQVFHAKLGVTLLLGIPAGIIAAVACMVTVPMTWLQRAMVLLVPIVFTVFTGLVGLVANLHLPRLDWINEMTVIKQSGSVILTLFGAMAMVILPVIVYIAGLYRRLALDTYVLVCCAIFILLCIGLYEYLLRKGSKLYQRL